jgi:hypothetical protein
MMVRAKHALQRTRPSALPVIALATVAHAVVGRRRAIYHRIWPALTLLGVSVVLVVALGRLDPGDFFE